MIRMLRNGWFKTAITGAFLAVIFVFAANWAAADVGSWQKGASIVPQSTTDFSSQSFKQSLANLASTNANFVTLIIPYYQSNTSSSDLHPGWNTPTDQSLIDGITAAHNLGLQVNLKVHLEAYDNSWRANINASDRSAWFAAYNQMLLRYGRIAQANGVKQFTVGAELINMASTWTNSSNTQNWSNMIKNLRGVYSGKLTYSANWGCCGWSDEKNNIGFWSDLDIAGVSAYYELGSDYYNNSPEALIQQWENVNRNDITPFANRVGKPVVFTEVGYKSVTGAHVRPWEYYMGGPADQVEQANNYEALFSYWNTQPFMQGVQLWDWKSNPNAGGSGDTDYTPQNKQAQQVMTKWFSGSGSPPPTTGGGIITTDFGSSATASPNPVSQGQPTTVTAQVTNNGGVVNNAIVDVEIYSSGGQLMLQRIFENQTFNAGQFQAYNFGWTPSSVGTYTVKIGVFNSSWSTLYNWQDTAGTITVGSGGTTPPPSNPPPSPPTNPPPPPPPTTGQIDIWWPSNGSTVIGAQPFKALLTNSDIGNYRMYWQVDGGQLNEMYNSNEDWPHKEAWVDVSGWSWNGAGPYTINFVAKDSSGNTLAQRQIIISVAR